MASCRVCGKGLMTGIVLHSECFEKLIKENEQLKSRLEKSIELPCKVGDMVYVITCDIGHFSCVPKVEKWKFDLELLEHFNKTVFLTKSEAEQALKERESR